MQRWTRKLGKRFQKRNLLYIKWIWWNLKPKSFRSLFSLLKNEELLQILRLHANNVPIDFGKMKNLSKQETNKIRMKCRWKKNTSQHQNGSMRSQKMKFITQCTHRLHLTWKWSQAYSKAHRNYKKVTKYPWFETIFHQMLSLGDRPMCSKRSGTIIVKYNIFWVPYSLKS